MAQAYAPSDNLIDEMRLRLERMKREVLPTFDDQEMDERTEAAQAYAGESPKHWVEYAAECVRTSRQAMTHVRQVQQECWNVYQEEEPPQYANKEPWQSRVVVPKPHSAVQFAKAQVRKAFTPQYLSIRHERRKSVSNFWEKLMRLQLDVDHANFVVRYTDATEMAFAIGQSLEMIAYWVPGQGLQYVNVEPWKIHRDPDAISRDPQSGMYWIHEEFQDLYLLKQGQDEGRYVNIGKVQEQTHNTENPDMDPEQEADRKKQFWQRNKFRHSALVREVWGTILGPRGDVLIPSGTYTVAGQTVIGLPEKTTYQTLRWPGVSFSPLPHLLRFDGRSLLHGVRALWYFMCSLMTLHVDNLNWAVNPMTEITKNLLVDQDDIDKFPGKIYVTRESMNGQQAIRNVEQRFITSEILANMQYGDSLFQTGTFVNATVQGLPGYRSEITAREQAQHLDQSLTVFASMGGNLETGALQAIVAGKETIAANITLEELQEWMSDEDLAMLEEERVVTPLTDMGAPMPQLQGRFSVSGLTAILEDMEVLRNMEALVIPMAESPVFGPYIKPYGVIRSIESRLNLQDEDVFANEDEAKQIAENQAVALEEAQNAQRALMESQIGIEQQRLALETEKHQLEGQKIALEAQNLERQAAIDAMKLEGERANLIQEQELAQIEIRKLEGELARIYAEIERTDHQRQLVAVQMQAHRDKLAMQREESQQRMRLRAEQAAQKKKDAAAKAKESGDA